MKWHTVDKKIYRKGSDSLAWQFTVDRPIYIQMAEHITSGILKGEYQMGEKLPSVREFALMASVNPNTVQRALFELENIGLIETQRNTGKFVTLEESRIEMSRNEMGKVPVADFIKSMKALGYSGEQIKEVFENERKAGESHESKNA